MAAAKKTKPAEQIISSIFLPLKLGLIGFVLGLFWVCIGILLALIGFVLALIGFELALFSGTAKMSFLS